MADVGDTAQEALATVAQRVPRKITLDGHAHDTMAARGSLCATRRPPMHQNRHSSSYGVEVGRTSISAARSRSRAEE